MIPANTKLGPAAVIRIRELYRRGMSLDQLAEDYGVARTTIYYAVSGHTWASLPGDYSPTGHARGEKAGKAKLTADAVRDIRKRWAAAEVSQTALAQEYGVSQPTINKIIHRETWKHV